MFYNRYAYETNLDMLQSRKPRMGIVPQGPDLANFITSNADLKRLANFGGEMMKFLPEFEQMAYEGKMLATPGEEGAVLISHGEDGETWVTQEWLEALNKYTVSVSEAEALGLDGISAYDADGDGSITNTETIRWAEASSVHTSVHTSDGMVEDRKTWISGQHHRVGRFGKFGSEDDSGFAGGGLGKNFKNFDLETSASEWNHINQRGNGAADSQALAIADQAYYIGDTLSAVGASWDEVKELFNRPQFQGKSFFDIVMDGSYKTLTEPRDSFLFIAALYESRERAWDCLTETVGPVTSTRNDAEMMANVNSFIKGNNPYLNHHALSLFPLFFYAQHSFLSQVTMFYEQGKAYREDVHTSRGDGYNDSVLDNQRFHEFVEWSGRGQYNADHDIDLTANRSGGVNMAEGGKLYEFRDSLSGTSGYDAVSGLIEEWFGATEREDEPRWEQYGDHAVDGGHWVTVSDIGTVTAKTSSNIGISLLPNQVLVQNFDSAAYGWDRKANANDFIITSSTNGDITYHVNQFVDGDGWTRLHNAIYPESRIELNALNGHNQYAVSQFYGLNTTQVMGASQAFASNWIVHDIGMYLKYGEGMDILSVLERCAKKRQIHANFKYDKTCYQERKEELEDEKAQDEKIVLKRMQKAKLLSKKSQHGSAKSASGNKPSGANQQAQHNNRDGHMKGTKEYSASLQKLNLRILSGSKKRKDWLKKLKESHS